MLIKGKKRRDTVLIVLADDAVEDNKVRVNKGIYGLYDTLEETFYTKRRQLHENRDWDLCVQVTRSQGREWNLVSVQNNKTERARSTRTRFASYSYSAAALENLLVRQFCGGLSCLYIY